MDKIKSILCGFLTCFLSEGNAQSSEYAYLVETEVTKGLHRNYGQVKLSIDSGQNTQTPSHAGHAFLDNVGEVFFDFLTLPNTWSYIDISVENHEISLLDPTSQCDTFNDSRYKRRVRSNNFTTEFFRESCGFKQKLYALHLEGPTNPDGTNKNLCYNETIELKGGYDWDYQIDTNGWEPLESKKTTININIEDLYTRLGLPTNGQSILRFRTGHRALDKFVAIKDYTVTTCSPKFEEYYSKKNYYCSYSRPDLDEGKISVKLSRAIEPTEQLVVTLFYVDDTGLKVLVNQLSTEPIVSTDPEIKLNNLGGGKFGFEWPEEIPSTAGVSDHYYFRYQTLNLGETPNQPSETDVFWDSLEKTASFRMDRPTNVVFSAKYKKDQSCFDVNDGQIEIYNAGGGTEEGYEYELNGNGTWISFDASNSSVRTVVVGSLPKGKVRLKIRDKNKCLSKGN